MVQTLYSNGANSIWEHSLLDPASVMSGKRKANPQDKLQWVTVIREQGRRALCSLDVRFNKQREITVKFPFTSYHCLVNDPSLSVSRSPSKSEFIKAKYQMLAFVHRMPCREDDSSTAKDLSKVRRRTKLIFADLGFAGEAFCNASLFMFHVFIYCICLYFPATSLKRPHRESRDLFAVALPRSTS